MNENTKSVPERIAVIIHQMQGTSPVDGKGATRLIDAKAEFGRDLMMSTHSFEMLLERCRKEFDCELIGMIVDDRFEQLVDEIENHMSLDRLMNAAPMPKPHPIDPAAVLAQSIAIKRHGIVLELEAERILQITQKGYTLEHDDQHVEGQLATAAAAFAEAAALQCTPGFREGAIIAVVQRNLWPSTWGEFPIKDQRRNLVIAGAIIVAELERIDRMRNGETANVTRETGKLHPHGGFAPHPSSEPYGGE